MERSRPETFQGSPAAGAKPAAARREFGAARLAVAALGLLACLGCGEDRAALAVRSFQLPGPPGSEPLYEPHLSIDPRDPGRLIVAAHYGEGYNRGGLGIWAWRSNDGGKRWTGADVPLPDPRAALAADAVTTFGDDGTAYLTFLFADTTGRAFDGGAALAAGTADSPGFHPARRVVAGGLNVAGAAVDKGWIAVDRSSTSPLRGTVYLSWHMNRPDFAAGTVSSTFWVASSRDRGRTFSEPVKVADAFSGQVAVARDGTVHVIYGDRAAGRLVHAASTDGGRSFQPTGPVFELDAGGTFDVPHLLVTPGDSLVVCWSETTTADSLRQVVRCARSRTGARWDPPVSLRPEPVPPEPNGALVGLGFPTSAASADGLWVLAYEAGRDTTRVVLFRSVDGGASFAREHDLAAVPGLACLAASAPCRRDPTAFFPGDYFGLAAVNQLVAAAYILPGSGAQQVHVSLVRPGPRSETGPE